MTIIRQPKISLVGAGPGDPDLITVKGLKALQSANVILYDALLDESLLNEAPEHALRIYVGKRANNHRYKQEEINRMLVSYAYNHGHVVRLKGGDPFVFGRGHEELTYARAVGVPVEVIPGLSSCTSLPGLQQVPVTRRGVNESFWVITGTTSSGALSDDIALAATSSATVIILMGMRKLGDITNLFAKAGKKDTPAMVIQNGSMHNQRQVVATVDTLQDEVAQAGIGAPGIIVIGEVVGLHPELQETILAKAKKEQWV